MTRQRPTAPEPPTAPAPPVTRRRPAPLSLFQEQVRFLDAIAGTNA